MRSRCALLSIGFLLCAVGCGPSQVTVKGTVTANGTEVEDGWISFQPVDGKNSSYGAPITKGKYDALVNPGKYAVLVSGGAKAPAYPKSQADLKNIPDKELEIRDQVPVDAKGNNREVEIAAKNQDLNIILEYTVPRR